MTEQAKVPAIRFAGFTDPWEQRKLSEVATFGGGHTPPMADPDNYEDGYVLWVTSQDVKSNYLDRTTTQITEKGAKELTLYPAGSLVMVTRSGILRHTLPVAELRKPSTVNQDIRVILPQGECCGEWLLQFFISHNKELLLEFGKTGTTVESVDFGKIKDMLLYMPSTVEQQQIGDFFAKLDSLITLHQRKYDKLVVFKKSMLEKMFPKDGESVPEIRFAGFTDPWEQRKLSELLLERDEQAPQSDQYPLMAFIANQGIAPKGDRYDRSALVNDIEGKLYKRTEKGDFIYSSNNLETGSIGLNKYGNACISPVYSIFQPSGIADSDFLGRRLVRKDFIQEMVKWRQGVIYGQWRIHEADFLRLNIAVPSVDEQRLIGKLLDNLDSLITLHQRKLELLQNIKKSLLDKMFV